MTAERKLMTGVNNFLYEQEFTEGFASRNEETGQITGVCDCPWCGASNRVNVFPACGASHSLLNCSSCDKLWAVLMEETV